SEGSVFVSVNALDLDDAADDGAGLHVLEALVDLLQAEALADHAVEVEASRAPQADDPAEVLSHVGRTVDGAAQRLLAEEQLEGVELDHVVVASHADDGRDAAAAYRVVRRANGQRNADRFERVVEALAPGDLVLHRVEAV